ncbi:MAG: GNAT family N-acetyltransferase [Thermoanaerobaculia bacterium]|nr:GNAT family N-acetyltransferase [Thermoanaerobaculia bacterium]
MPNVTIHVATTQLPRLRDLALRASDSPYDLACVLEEKCFGRGFSGEPVARVVEEEGAIRGLSVTCGKYLRLILVDRGYRRRGIGSALLGNVSLIGAEPGNYFTPGVVESDDATIAFLRARGFNETASTWNLGVTPHAALHGAEGVVAPAQGDRERFLSFVEREFGAIWRFEAARALDVPAPRALWIEETGFVVWEANNRGLGTFGPTGVAKAHREKGHGRRLLLAALSELRALGHERVTIPWTDAIDFYRRSCGAEPAHRFITFAKPL